MSTPPDVDLLHEFVARNSQPAFAELVSRYVNMVYSVAVRRVGNHHQAEEITQAVFIILARKARSLGRSTVLSGWLFHTARLTAANFQRSEIRRFHREQGAFMQAQSTESSAADCRELMPHLDDAIAGLGARDRDAIVLRFINGRDNHHVAAVLGVTEGAAQVRVSRAVEKLRKILARRGVALSAAGLTGAIAAHSVQAAPAALAASVTAGAIQGAVLAASTVTLVKGTLNLMAWSKTQITIGLALIAVVGYQYARSSAQNSQLAAVRAQLTQAQQQLDAQADALRKIAEENSALAEDKRNAEAAAARLRAEKQLANANAASAATRNAASNSTASPSSDTTPPASGLARILADPVLKQYLVRKEFDKMRTRYESLLTTLNLSADQSDQFIQILGNARMTNIEIGVAFTQGQISRADAHQAADAAAASVATQLQSLLGSAGYAQFQQYNQELPAQTAVKLLNNQLTDNPLTADQSTRLFQLVMTEPFHLTHGIAGDSDAVMFSSPENVENYFQQVADSHQRLLQQAAGFLSADQLSAFGTVLTNTLADMRSRTASLMQKQ